MAMSEIGRQSSQVDSKPVDGKGMRVRVAGSPLAWIMAFALAAIAGLILPLRLPLGPNAWDTVVYLDAIPRIELGQVPTIDLLAPIGPRGV